MANLFNLGGRLNQCGEYVRENSRLVDIGTDHGYLPIWLLHSGKITSAIAADIGEGPLRSAVKNSEKYGVAIKTVLSDGFKEINADDFDDAVIAGMGGGLIKEIISKADFLKNEAKHLILQPMTAVPELREYLYNNGFEIREEEALVDEGKIYSVMSVFFTNQIEEIYPYKLYMGELKPSDEFSKLYAEKTVKKMRNKHKGLVHTGEDGQAQRLMNVIEEIERLFINEA